MFEGLYENFNFPFQPRDYQRETVEQLSKIDKAGAFLAVGLGKTAVAMWTALADSIYGSTSQILLIVPPALINQWEEYVKEITFRNGNDQLQIGVYYGSPAKRNKMALQVKDVIITSHQIFRLDFQKFTKLFGANQDMFVIFDELHMGCRKVSNKIFRCVKQFTKNKKFLGLTATPISNPGDGYAICKLINPVYTSKIGFESVHVGEKDFFGNVTRWCNLDMLHKNLFKNAVKLEAEGLLELPDVNYITFPYDLKTKHLKMYNQLKDDEMLKTDDGEILDATEATRMFHTLQRFITAPDKLDIHRVQSNLMEIVETIYHEDESPIIFFANYKNTNEALVAHFEKLGIPTAAAWGAFTRNQQTESVKRFQAGDAKVLIGNPISIGVGLNLQHCCHRICFVELPLTSREFEQAVGRCYRQGQKEKVTVKILQAKGTIQVPLYKHLLHKDDLVQEVMKNKKGLRKLLT